MSAPLLHVRCRDGSALRVFAEGPGVLRVVQQEAMRWDVETKVTEWLTPSDNPLLWEWLQRFAQLGVSVQEEETQHVNLLRF